MYDKMKKRIIKSHKEVESMKRFHQAGYREKRWDERNPNIIKNLIEAERHLMDAYYLLEEITQ